jgi:molybdopterin biosynthesis enzyme
LFNVKEAKKILWKNIKLIPAVSKKVSDISGYVLAENIKSPVDLPLFDQSAMDGFAVNFDAEDLRNEELSFRITGEIKAGDKPNWKAKKEFCGLYLYRRCNSLKYFLRGNAGESADKLRICDNSGFSIDKRK